MFDQALMSKPAVTPPVGHRLDMDGVRVRYGTTLAVGT
jgi:hypothetical protein